MNKPEQRYTDRLVTEIPRTVSVPGWIVELERSGAIRLTEDTIDADRETPTRSGAIFYATPDWDQPDTIEISDVIREDSDGKTVESFPAGATVPVEWTEEIEIDAWVWRAIAMGAIGKFEAYRSRCRSWKPTHQIEIMAGTQGEYVRTVDVMHVDGGVFFTREEWTEDREGDTFQGTPHGGIELVRPGDFGEEPQISIEPIKPYAVGPSAPAEEAAIGFRLDRLLGRVEALEARVRTLQALADASADRASDHEREIGRLDDRAIRALHSIQVSEAKISKLEQDYDARTAAAVEGNGR